MDITTSTLICFQCCATAGLAVAGTQTRTTVKDDGSTLVENVVHLVDGASPDQIDAINAFVASPPSHNHPPPPNPALVAASQRWLVLQTQLASIPAAPGSGTDPYAAIRARVTTQTADALADAQALGGPI